MRGNGEIHGNPLKTEKSMAYNCLAVSADGKFVASGCYDGTVQLWDHRERNSLGILMRGHGEKIGVSSIAFSGDGNSIVAGSDDGSGLLLEYGDTRIDRRPHYGLRFNGVGVNAFSFSPDGLRVASSVMDLIRVWDAKTSMRHVVKGEFNAYAYNMNVRRIAFRRSREAVCLRIH